MHKYQYLHTICLYHQKLQYIIHGSVSYISFELKVAQQQLQEKFHVQEVFIKTDLAISSRFMYEQARNLVSDKRYDLLFIHQPHHLFMIMLTQEEQVVLSLYHSMKTNAKTLSQRRRLLILDAMLPLKQQARRKVSKSKRASTY